LFLEIFGECTILRENLENIIRAPIRKLNWTVLPKGKMPWEQLKSKIKPIVKEAPPGNQPIIWSRFESINRFNPNFVAIGQAGFRGYIILGFPEKNIYVCECIFTGNATYVFEQNWEKLTQLTKAEILNEKLQKDRIIHWDNWREKINNLLGN